VNGPGKQLAAWKEALRTAYLPDALVLFIPTGTANLPPVLDKPAVGEINAWVCEGATCLAPIGQQGALHETLKVPKISASRSQS
jgi:uncharacterized protein